MLKIKLCLLAFCFLVGCSLVFLWLIIPHEPFGITLYEKIQPGMTLSDVIAVAGEPSDRLWSTGVGLVYNKERIFITCDRFDEIEDPYNKMSHWKYWIGYHEGVVARLSTKDKQTIAEVHHVQVIRYTIFNRIWRF